MEWIFIVAVAKISFVVIIMTELSLFFIASVVKWIVKK